MIISTTSICKNELNYIQPWYDSLKDEVDYITILDTGSTDGTYELLQDIASKDSKIILDQKIITPWRFDRAREEAMELLPKETSVFVPIDMDERFDTGFGQVIRNNWKPEHYQGSYMYMRDLDSHPFKYFRLYANNNMWHWEYPVHEMLLCEPFGKSHSIDLSDKITLRHYQPKGTERNYLPLLELRKEEYPDDPMTYFYLTREYCSVDQWEKLIEVVDEFSKKKLKLAPVEVAYMCMFRGFAYGHLNNERQLIDSLESAINSCPEYRDPYVALITYLLNIGAKTIAKDIMIQCLEKTHRLYVMQEDNPDCWDEKFEDLKKRCGIKESING